MKNIYGSRFFSIYFFEGFIFSSRNQGEVLCILNACNIIAYHFQTSIHFFEDLKRNKEKLKITKRIIGRRCLRKSHSFKPSEIKMLIYFQIYFLMKKRDAMWKTIGRKRKEQKSLFSNEVFKCFFLSLFQGQTSIKRRKCRQKSGVSSDFTCKVNV